MSTQTITSELESQKVQKSNWLNRHSMLAYGVLAYGLSWGIGFGAFAAIENGSLDPDGALTAVLSQIAPASPAISALIVIAATGGKRALADWLRRIVKWRVGPQWYFFTLLGMPMIIMAGYSFIFGVPLFQLFLQKWTVALPILVPTVLFTIFQTGLAEEAGWRGFALPGIQAKYGPLLGSLVLGVFWAMWHLPNIVFSPAGPAVFALQFAAVMLNTFLHTWVYNRTRGSVLMSILMHSTINSTSGLIGFLVGTKDIAFQYQAYTAGLISTAVIVLVICLITRGRLGYEAEKAEIV
jgi:membrane protease YdiL (CAAX protease family)